MSCFRATVINCHATHFASLSYKYILELRKALTHFKTKGNIICYKQVNKIDFKQTQNALPLEANLIDETGVLILDICR